MDHHIIREFIRLTERRRQIKGEDEDLKDKLKMIEKAALDELTKAGSQRVTLDDQTVYIRREVRASAGGNMPRTATGASSASLNPARSSGSPFSDE